MTRTLENLQTSATAEPEVQLEPIGPELDLVWPIKFPTLRARVSETTMTRFFPLSVSLKFFFAPNPVELLKRFKGSTCLK